MKVTIREARKLAKDLRKKHNCYCSVSIEFDYHKKSEKEIIYVYIQNKKHKYYDDIKHAREELL